MHHRIVKRLGLLVAAASFMAVSPALAVPVISTTLASPGSTTITEGNSITLVFQVTNNTGSTYFQAGNGWNYSFVSGDSSDGPPSLAASFNFSPAGYTGCGASLAGGNSCYYAATFTTPSDTGETDGDFGVWDVLTEIGWSLPGVGIDYVANYTTVTVQDPRVETSVPEPLTLSLFSVGLVGAAALRRRKPKA